MPSWIRIRIRIPNVDPDPELAEQNECGLMRSRIHNTGSGRSIPGFQRLCHTYICTVQGSSSLDLCSGVSRSSAAAAAKCWDSGVAPTTSGGSGAAPAAGIGDNWRDLLQKGVQEQQLRRGVQGRHLLQLGAQGQHLLKLGVQGFRDCSTHCYESRVAPAHY
jgi:hypothetical protein